jgi:hypothetical protein
MSLQASSRVAAIATLLLCSCATDPAWEERYAEGWRRANVYRIAEANELSIPARYDCRKSLSADALSGRSFVVYRYRGSGAFPWVYAVHPLPAAIDLKEGRWVLVNVKNCAGKPQLL